MRRDRKIRLRNFQILVFDNKLAILNSFFFVILEFIVDIAQLHAL